MINENELIEYLEDVKLNILLNEPLLGYIISNLSIIQDEKIETLCIYFNNDIFKYEIKYNFKFLLTLKNFKEVSAVFKHELYHLIFKHHFRAIAYEKQYGYIDMKTANISMDIAINQYIENLPETALKYSDFNVEKELDFETYYKYLYKDNKSDNNGKDNNGSSKSETSGKNTNAFDSIKNNDPLSSEKKEKDNNKSEDKSEKENQKASGNNGSNEISNSKLENHNELIESVKNQDIEIIEKITDTMIKDAIKQTSNKYGKGGFITELENITFHENKIHWKKIIKQFIEKSVLSKEKEETWFKINRRFELMKGKRKLFNPEIMIAIDTSGSISEKTIYNFLNELKHIFKIVKFDVIYFHSEVYNHFQNIDENNIKKIQRGGTFLQSPINYAKNKKIKNLIVMTDGYGEQLIDIYNLKTIFIKDNLEEIYIPKITKIKGYNIFNIYPTIKVSN